MKNATTSYQLFYLHSPHSYLEAARGVPFSSADVEFFQPPIVATQAPERPITNFSLFNNTTKVNLAPMRPIVPTFNGKGNLLASWTPHPDGVKNRPTFVIVHGGHGLVRRRLRDSPLGKKRLRREYASARQLLESRPR
jgi:hypothetical protein